MRQNEMKLDISKKKPTIRTEHGGNTCPRVVDRPLERRGPENAWKSTFVCWCSSPHYSTEDPCFEDTSGLERSCLCAYLPPPWKKRKTIVQILLADAAVQTNGGDAAATGGGIILTNGRDTNRGVSQSKMYRDHHRFWVCFNSNNGRNDDLMVDFYQRKKFFNNTSHESD